MLGIMSDQANCSSLNLINKFNQSTSLHSWKTWERHLLCVPTLWLRKKCGNIKWRKNAKNLTKPYNGHFENLTEPYSKENKTLQNLTQHLCQVVVTLLYLVLNSIPPPSLNTLTQNFSSQRTHSPIHFWIAD